MNRTTKAFDTEEHAAEWLVRLDADASTTTLASWAQWVREDTCRHAAYVRVEAGWRQLECLKSLRPLDGTVRVDLLDGIEGVVWADVAGRRKRSGSARQADTARGLRPRLALRLSRSSRPSDPPRRWRTLTLSRLPSPYTALAIALGAGALASLLVLAGWRFLMTAP